MRYRFILISLIVTILIFFVASPCFSQEIIFKMAHNAPPTKVTSKAMEWMSDYIFDRSNGRIKMEVYHMGVLNDRDGHTGIEMTMSGAIEMFLDTNILLVEWDPRYQVNLLPFMFNGMDDTYKLTKSQFGKEEMASWVKDKGLMIIGWLPRPFRQLTNNRNSVRAPEDLDGMKVRVPSGGIMLDTLKALGADPTPMPMGEVYTSLQLKTIHAQENSVDSIMNNKMYEVCDYLTYWNYVGDLSFLGVNLSWWENLAEEDKEIIREGADKAADYNYFVNRHAEPQLLEELSESGLIQVDMLTQDELDVFKEAVQPVWEKYAEIVGRDNIEAINKLLAQ